MKYYVTYRINALYTTAVDCESFEEARRAAEDNFCEADFGEAEDVEATVIFVEDEDGDTEW